MGRLEKKGEKRRRGRKEVGRVGKTHASVNILIGFRLINRDACKLL